MEGMAEIQAVLADLEERQQSATVMHESDTTSHMSSQGAP